MLDKQNFYFLKQPKKNILKLCKRITLFQGMKIISPYQSKTQHAFFKHGKWLSQVFHLFLCIFINGMPSFTEKSDDLVLIGACSLSSKRIFVEIKDFLFPPVPTMPPHQHLWSNLVMNLVRNQSQQSGIKHCCK